MKTSDHLSELCEEESEAQSKYGDHNSDSPSNSDSAENTETECKYERDPVALESRYIPLYPNLYSFH